MTIDFSYHALSRWRYTQMVPNRDGMMGYKGAAAAVY